MPSLDCGEWRAGGGTRTGPCRPWREHEQVKLNEPSVGLQSRAYPGEGLLRIRLGMV